MLKDDRRLQAREVRKEPSAARVHLQCVPLHLQKFEAPRLAAPVETFHPVAIKEAVQILRGSLQNHIDVAVPRLPWIFENGPSFGFKNLSESVPQEVKRLSQGLPPSLIPAGPSSGAAAAVFLPSGDSMDAAPRRPLSVRSFIDLHFMDWRKALQEGHEVDRLQSLCLKTL